MSEPERIGPFVIEGVLGRGGAGVVHLARDPSGARVALKRIRADDEELARRLLREADVRVRHENVVRGIGAGLDREGQPYIVTELLEGESLRARLTRPIAACELVGLMAQAARGLAALHAEGIVHRDLKPANLFITSAGVLKILDFGTASFAEARTVLTATGDVLGTPAYLAPEQARGERRVDFRADLWGLGMTLYEGLTGELPFRRRTLAATALAIQHDPLPSLFMHRPDLPLELGILVERCLARRPSDRPESASSVAAELESMVFDAPSRASQPILPRADETWRNVALVLLDGVGDRAALEDEAGALDGTTFPLFARSAVVLFGADTSRGDELSRALELALATSERCRVSVVTDARVRTSGREIDPAALEEAMTLIDRAPRGVLLSAHAAALADRTLSLRSFPDGAALVLGDGGAAPLSPIVGREAELRRLLELARAARDGRACDLAIAGEAGIGKTALIRALVGGLGSVAPGAAVVVARPGARPDSPLGVLLRALALAAPEESDPQRALDRRRLAILDRLGELLALHELTVLVLEDLQQADPQSVALLHELSRLFAERPLLVVTTRRAPAGADLTLGPLDDVAIAALVERELGADLGRRVAREVAVRSGGNPLFAEHLVRLARTHGAEGAVAGWNLPLTVESAVQARLDVLPAELRDAVHGLAVLGAEAELAETRLALGSRASAWLSRLAAADVVELDATAPRAPGWRFKSRIVAEVAYAALDPSEATRLHRTVAERLARDESMDPEVVLRHAERGEAHELASRFARAALLAAARGGDGRRVLELLPRVERDGGADFTALFLAAEAAAFVESAVRPETLLEQALALAQTGDERGAVLAELGERARRAGRLTEARALLERARMETTVLAVGVRARAREALVHVSEERAAEALALLDVPLDALPATVRALVWETRGYAHGALGALGPRRDAYERAAALYAEAGDARRAAGASANLGDTMRQMGDLAAAEVTLRRAAEGARRIGNGLTEAYASANLAGTHIAAGRLREAAATLELASERAEAVSDARLLLVTRLYFARARGQPPAPADLAEARARDRTLHAMALACQLELGAPTEAELDEAAALLARASEIEEGALELGRGLYRHRPTDAVGAVVNARLEAIYRSIGGAAWQSTFVSHVERALGALAEPFVASVRARQLQNRDER